MIQLQQITFVMVKLTKTNVKNYYLHYNAQIFGFFLHSQANFSKIEYQQFTLCTIVHNGHNTDTQLHNLTQRHQTNYCPLGTNDRIRKKSNFKIISKQVQSLIMIHNGLIYYRVYIHYLKKCFLDCNVNNKLSIFNLLQFFGYKTHCFFREIYDFR